MKRLCLAPGCPERVTHRGRCRSHTMQWKRFTHRNQTVYNSRRWKMLRKRRLFLDSLCPCGEIATDVDHIVAIEDGGPAFSLENTQSLCRSCHSVKTRREMQGRGGSKTKNER